MIVIDALIDAAQELEDNQQVNDVVEYLIDAVEQQLPEEMPIEEVPEAIEAIGQQVEHEVDPEIRNLVIDLVNRVVFDFEQRQVSDFDMQVGMRGFDFLEDLEDEPLPDDQIVARQPWHVTQYRPFTGSSSKASSSGRQKKPIALPYPRDQYGPIHLPYGQWPQTRRKADDVAIQIDPIEQVEHDRDVRRQDQRLYPGPPPDQVVIPIDDENVIDENESSDNRGIDEEEDETCIYCTETEEDDPTKGPIISACDCQRPHRYHYRCLGEWIIAYDDPMCSVCGKQFVHQWIKRSYTPRRIFGFFHEVILRSYLFYVWLVLVCWIVGESVFPKVNYKGISMVTFIVIIIFSAVASIVFIFKYLDYFRRQEGTISFKYWPPDNVTRVVQKRDMGRNMDRIENEPYMHGID